MCPCKKMSWLSRFTVLLFSVLGLWYTLHPFGVPMFGEFWNWVMILFGVYIIGYSSSQSYEQTARLARWIGAVVFFVGTWFLVGEYWIILVPSSVNAVSKIGITGSCLVMLLGMGMIVSRFFRTCSHPLWYSVTFTSVGVWFLLGDKGYLPTFGISLLHLMVFLLPIGMLICCSSCHKSDEGKHFQLMIKPDESKPKLGTEQYESDDDEWENL